ncbi:4'-phosphopantetheinyl transferase family protein [Marilutibacter spongiae]|uniref:4'-phosphopantetheinyl transferase superfamily protein n=1 Tax=Marilutibacter spongiae TaxID=2025720 RepID=A0A7W3TN75_9GAMM|nr:4'-phosphopantetheinyl transferase superfamily protein [Lysobacter spongiae]MBB1061451.1 4'-phosphopantetheinyl transferase superfamily protein [Lysobacter spongiae]
MSSQDPHACPASVDALFADFSACLRAALPGTPRWPATFAVLLECDAWIDRLADARALIGEAERERVDRQRRPGDRDMHALAYAFHRMTAACATGLQPSRLALVRDAMGCPRLPGTPWHTSLSHADGAVAVALSLDGPVGIDLEARAKAAMLPELVDSVCTASERRRLAGEGTGLGASLLELWVRKEALLKATGQGMSLEMTAIDAPPDAWLPLPGDGREIRIRMLEAGPAHVAALASLAPGEPPVIAWLAPPAPARG